METDWAWKSILQGYQQGLLSIPSIRPELKSSELTLTLSSADYDAEIITNLKLALI
jgi:hypothetical protein